MALKMCKKKTPSADGCVVYYHTACKKFTGRATPILYILEHAGVSYTVEEPKDVPDTWPHFAVPAIKFADGTIMSQTAAICQALGKSLGMAAGDAEEFHAMQAALNTADILAEGAKLKEEPGHARMKKWFGVYEKMLEKTGSGYLVGEKLSWADYAACWALPPRFALLSDADKKEFPKMSAWLTMLDGCEGIKKVKATGVPLLPG